MMFYRRRIFAIYEKRVTNLRVAISFGMKRLIGIKLRYYASKKCESTFADASPRGLLIYKRYHIKPLVVFAATGAPADLFESEVSF